MSVTFNGTTQYLTIDDDAALTLTPPWAVSLWFRVLDPDDSGYILAWGTPATATSFNVTIYSQGHGTYPGQLLVSALDASGNRVVLNTGTVTGSSEWQHLAINVSEAGVLEVFVDNVSAGTNTNANYAGTNNSDPFYVGRWSGGSFVEIQVSEVAKYDACFTADQRAELLVKPAGLISAAPGWWLPCYSDLAEKTAGLTVTPYGDAAANPADHPVAYFRPAWAQNVNRCIGLGV